ncbi:hypothetical protein AAVH_38058, partial [Aphelenchoides avenae]
MAQSALDTRSIKSTLEEEEADDVASVQHEGATKKEPKNTVDHRKMNLLALVGTKVKNEHGERVFGRVEFLRKGGRTVVFRSSRIRDGHVFVFGYARIFGEGASAKRVYTCVDCMTCKPDETPAFVLVRNYHFIGHDPDDPDIGHACLDDDAEIQFVPRPMMETNFGQAKFLDNSQASFVYESRRYPGVKFLYGRVSSCNGRTYYTCRMCRPYRETSSTEGTVVVVNGVIVGNDPDYPQRATGHLCQGGVQSQRKRKANGKVNRRSLDDEDTSSSGTPEKVRRAEAAADRLERLLKRKFGEGDSQKQRAEPLVQRIEAAAPRADARPASAMPALHTATQKPVAPQHHQQPVAHPVVQQQPSAVQWYMPQAFFGYALRKPFNDASIYYKSVFYSGHVFRFDLVAEYVGDGIVNRCYRCSDCFQMCLMPQFSCFATQTIITVNDRIVHRDPDAPQ